MTRREWSAGYAARFRKDDLVAAYDRNPRFKGQQVGVIRLTQSPYQERLRDAPDSDYAAEGLAWMEERGLKCDGLPARTFWRAWKISNPLVWVVRFKIINPVQDWTDFGGDWPDGADFNSFLQAIKEA